MIARGPIGVTGLASVQAQICDSQNRVWDGSAFATLTPANWAAACLPAVEFGQTGEYLATVPIAARANASRVRFFETNAVPTSPSPNLVRATWQPGTIFASSVANFAAGTSGLTTAKAVCFRANGDLFRTSDNTWVPYSSGDWANAVIDAVEVLFTGEYAVTIPAAAAAEVLHVGFFANATAPTLGLNNLIGSWSQPTPNVLTPAPAVILFDPTAIAGYGNEPAVPINRSSGAPAVKFVPTTPFVPVVSEWSCRIGTRLATVITLTSVSGLNVEGNGTMTANFTIAQSASLPLDQVVWLELWRTGPGDDNNYPVLKRRVQVLRSLT